MAVVLGGFSDVFFVPHEDIKGRQSMDDHHEGWLISAWGVVFLYTVRMIYHDFP